MNDDTIRTSKIEIVDKKGRPRIILSAESATPEISVLDIKGKKLLKLTVDSNAGAVFIYSHTDDCAPSKLHLIIGADADYAGISCYDENRNPRLIIGNSVIDGEPILELLDEKGDPIVNAEIIVDDEAWEKGIEGS